ncbi:YncE family protein [Paracoccus denitrificans]|uniref:YncE family protein n=1 Tax=Paracoccus denitrificans TaxID=266 RepID=UPI001319EA8B|nr:YncE family protein [Paracoccus denitrificans]
MDHGNGRLYVGHTLSGAVSILDARSGLVLDHVQLGKTDAEGKTEHIRMIEVDEATGRVFVSSPSRSGTVWIVDTRNGNAVQRIDDIGLWAAGLAHDTERSRLYVSGGGIEEIAVLDSATGERVSAISTGDTTEPGAEASRHFLLNLALDPGGRLFATDASTGRLYVFDIETGGTIASVPVGKGILDTVFNPQRNEIYVTWRGAGHEDHEGTGGLAVIDGTTLELRSRIDLPVHPNSLAVSPDGNLLFLTVKRPLDKQHPDYRKGASDTVMRVTNDNAPPARDGAGPVTEDKD